MALVECPDCHNSVSDKAAACPHCGHPIAPPAPTMVLKDKSDSKTIGCGVALVLLVGFVVVAMIAGNSDEKKEQSKPTCKSDWHLCSDNADLVNNFTGIGLGQIRCKDEATKLAKYGDPKFPWLAFGTFHRGDDYVKTGVVTLIEKEAQFQNGFGAMVHSTVICNYDLNTEKVTDVNIIAN